MHDMGGKIFEFITRRYRLIKYLVLGIPILWLALAALLIKVEYYDGYEAVGNALFLLGLEDLYIANRAPLFAFLLLPGRWLGQILGLAIWDPRPWHAVTMLLHIAFLLAVYHLLEQRHGRNAAVVLAFTGAVLTFVFFSYSPFISHYIFPGLLFFAMLYLADIYMKNPSWRRWGMLVLLGAAGALLKQTFGLFWLTILLAQGSILIWDRQYKAVDEVKKSCFCFPDLPSAHCCIG